MNNSLITYDYCDGFFNNHRIHITITSVNNLGSGL